MSIRQSPKLKNAMAIVNTLEPEKYELFLSRILGGLKVSQKQIFSEQELHQLENILNLEPSQLSLLIQASAFLFEQVADLKLQREGLVGELATLGMVEECIDSFLNVWSELGAEYLVHLRGKLVGLPVLLEKFEWKLGFPLGSNTENNSQAKAGLKLKLSDGSHFEASVDSAELLNLFAKLEMIQGQIDSLL